MPTGEVEKANKGYHWEEEWAASSCWEEREGEKRGSRKSQEAQSDLGVASPYLACEQWGNPLGHTFPFCNRQIGGSEQNNGDLLRSRIWCSHSPDLEVELKHLQRCRSYYCKTKRGLKQDDEW